MAITVEARTEIISLVVGMFGAAPGASVLSDLVAAYEADPSIANMAANLANTNEFKSIYPTFLTNGEYATKVVNNLLAEASAEAKAEAVDILTGELNGGMSRTEAMAAAINFVNSTASTNTEYGTSAAAFDNKVEVAIYYSVEKQLSGDSLSALQAVVSGVTSAAGTVTTAKATVDGDSSVGKTFTLTNSIDTVTGTSGDDVIIAGSQAGTATLTAGDTIAGGTGTDRLNIINSTGAINSTNFASSNITSIEKVYLTASATAETLSVSGNSDVTEVWVEKGFDTVITLAKTQTAGISGAVNGAGAAQTFTFTSATGLADTINLALAGASVSTNGVDIQDIETINVTATGTNSLTKFDSDATKLVVNSAGSLNFGTLQSGGGASVVTTIDASASAGGVTADNSSAAAAVETITGGAGNDSYTTLFANLTKDDKIDLGAGTDTLQFKDAVTLTTTVQAAVLGGVSNVETLAVTGGAFAFSVNADEVTQTTFVHDSTGAFTGTNFSSTDKLTIGDVVAAASTVGMKLGQNTFNITLAGGSAAASDATAGVTVSGASTINIASSGTTGVANNVLNLKTDDNGSVTITGSQNTTLTTVLNTGTTGLSISASAATGKLDITGTGVADIIVGGSGDDKITGGAGVDTLTGNGGADTFAFATADVDTTAGAVTDIITDFVTKTDKITTGFGAGTAANYVEAASAAADLATLLTAADAALTGAVKYYVGQVGSDSYLVTDNNATGYTDVIKLTGVALTGIEFGDITA